jgi:hypothetical protein
MPDPSHRPFTAMTIIRPHAMPAFWWLVPWAYARVLHRAANALRALSDRQHDIIKVQEATIADLSDQVSLLRRRIADQDDAIIRGSASVRDAGPIPEDCES